MADNIRNFNDYRRKVDKDRQETEEINIEIQDPLDFLDSDEREEYYRTQHEAMDRERESISSDSDEFYFDDDFEVEAPPLDDVKEPEPIEEEPSSAREQAPVRRDSRGDRGARPAARKRAASKEKPVAKEKRAPKAKQAPKKQKAAPKKEKPSREREEDWFDEDEDAAGGINPYVIVRIASIITGIIILVMIGMIFKAKVYDVYLRPDPDEIRGKTAVGEIAGYTYTNDKVTTTADLNLRNTPSTASDDFIEVQVPEGTVLDRIAVSDDGVWAQVEYNERVLYCVMKYLSVNE